MADISDFFDLSLGIANVWAGAQQPDITYVNAGGGPTGYTPGEGFAMDTIEKAGEMGGAIMGPPPAACGGSPVYKKVCGAYRWVYPKRRRRKQLLTKSDAAGLAQLKGIVGVGKTMSSWIATHPS